MKETIAIVGRGPGWENDLNELIKINGDVDILAVGKSCDYHGHVDMFATYHTKEVIDYISKRKEWNTNTDFLIITHEPFKNIKSDYIIPYKKPSGSSALLGTFAAIKHGYKNIVLCGCPLTGVNDRKHPYGNFRQGWKFHKEKLNNQVRSMSGWTMEFLGGVTKEWLDRREK